MDWNGLTTRVTRRAVNLEKRGEPTENAKSAAPVPVIRQLANILNAYRSSMGNPKTGVVFHAGNGERVDLSRECSSRAAGKLENCANLLKRRRGEVAERLKAAVC